MKRMAGRLSARIGRFVDEHRVHRSDVGSSETFDIVQHPGMETVLEKYLIIDKILGLVEQPLSSDSSLSQGNVLHHRDVTPWYPSVTQGQESFPAGIQQGLFNQFGDDQKSIVFVKLSLLQSEQGIV